VTLGTSLFLIAVGAILKYAVHADVSGVSISTVGLILMIIGVIGLIISLIYLTAWRNRGRDEYAVRDRYRDRGPAL
jgi:hypothetical protein